MLATFSVGWRWNTPSMTIDAIVSWMARSATMNWPSTLVLPAKAWNFGAPPHMAVNAL